MSDEMAMLGIEKCGCITYANAKPEWMDAEDVRALNRIRKAGGTTRLVSLKEARTLPHFLPGECPHKDAA